MIVVVLVGQSCTTLFDSMDCSPPGSNVRWIFQAIILEWLPFPSPGNLPDPGIKPGSPALQADSLPFELQGTPSSYIQIVECYAETKRNRLLTPSTTPSTTQMDLRNIMLSERRQLFYDFIYMKYPEGASL